MNVDLFNILLSAYLEETDHNTIQTIGNSEHIKDATELGYLDSKGILTQAGKVALEPYKVDNAIIMAAGLSNRCKPLSSILPKGLFCVKDEILIEREINQLLEAGVKEIYVVVGYKSELYEYLSEKYGVHLVYNPEYDKKNNVSSIYAAREYLGNSYICCADNYYAENIFRPYEYESYYTCIYTKEYADEYCITEDNNGFIQDIHRGGEEQWFTIGANYWSRNFSEKFKALLEQEYDNPETGNLLIDDFHINFFSELPITARKFDNNSVFEFDTLDEFAAFDSDFNNFKKELIANNLYGKYNDITRYAGVKTNIKTGRLHFNENLWGPSPKALIPFHNAALEDLYLYDSQDIDDLVLAISKKYNFKYENIFLHNSGSEIVRSIFTIMISDSDSVLLPMPHWSYYPGVVDYRFGNNIYYQFNETGDKCYHDINDLMYKAEIAKPKIIIVTSPAMPSGNLIKPDDLEFIIKNNPESLIFVDQAYFGFAEDSINVNYFIERYDNVVFARTFSKFFGLAGLRLGYGIASERAMKALWLDLPLLRLPIIARRAVIECLNDDDYYVSLRQKVKEAKDWLYTELNKLQYIHPYKSDSNFIFMKVINIDAIKLREIMIEKGYIFRLFEYNDAQYFRINVAPMDVMYDFMNRFKEAIAEVKES